MPVRLGKHAGMPALQRTEAAVRAQLLDVRSYSVDLDLTRGDRLFRSTTVIRFGCAEPGRDSFVDIDPAALLRAELNGRPLDPAAFDGNPAQCLTRLNRSSSAAQMSSPSTTRAAAASPW